MEGIRAVLTSTVSYQTIIASFAFVLLNQLLEFGFVLFPDGEALIGTSRSPAEITDTLFVEADPRKTFVKNTFLARLHKTPPIFI
jgi:hypothetical protein